MCCCNMVFSLLQQQEMGFRLKDKCLLYVNNPNRHILTYSIVYADNVLPTY